MAIWSAEIRELEQLYESLKGQSPDLEKELAQLIHFDDPNVIMLYSRRCLEVILTDLCDCELKRQRGTEPLKGIIDKLHKERKVPDHIATSMHGLNDLSTYGTHPKDFDPEQVKPVLINLDIIIKWYLKYKGIQMVVKPKQEVQIIDVKHVKEQRYLLRKKSPVLRPQILITLVILGILFFLLDRNSRKKWAKQIALPEIEKLYNEENLVAAFNLVLKAEKHISKNDHFDDLASKIKSKVTILTNPSGARIYTREYADTAGKWREIGKTPINSIELPKSSFYLMRIEKEGYENVITVGSTELDTIFRLMYKKGSIPPGMVYVEGCNEEVRSNFFSEKHGFFIDRYEVTNKQFKEFVDNGGYNNRKYWKHVFIKDGKILEWEEAMSLFTDLTGKPGPSTWEVGNFADGMDNYPVSGISWYEAAAYAEYKDKSLPTGYHWGSGAGLFYDPFWYNFGSKIIPFSNFNRKGAEQVGKLQGISCFGAYDMAGNVREWCWNETNTGRLVCGGAWDDYYYMFTFWSQLPPFDRSPKNGFRCVKYINRENVPEDVFKSMDFSNNRDYFVERPVSEEVFRIYKRQFLYDKTDLNPKIETADTINSNWITEKITFNAAYGNDRIAAYLYLPKNIDPPFQTIIYFPWVDAIYEKDLNKPEILDYIKKSGRAVLYPIYKGTHERNDGLKIGPHYPNQSHQYTQWLIYWVKDLSRSIDYLETRNDIDSQNLGFLGISWGAMFTPIMPAVEERLKICISILGGFPRSAKAYPEADAINYVSRVKIPILMLNGRYDANFPLESTVKTMYSLIGTPEKDKRLCIYNTDHHIPRNEEIREVLAWCDKYLEPVKFNNK